MTEHSFEFSDRLVNALDQALLVWYLFAVCTCLWGIMNPLQFFPMKGKMYSLNYKKKKNMNVKVKLSRNGLHICAGDIWIKSMKRSVRKLVEIRKYHLTIVPSGSSVVAIFGIFLVCQGPKLQINIIIFFARTYCCSAEGKWYTELDYSG